MVFRCGAIINTLPYDFALFEEPLTFMESVEDQRDMASKIALVDHLKDPLPPKRDFTTLFRRCEDIVLSLILDTHPRLHTVFCGVRQTGGSFW